MKRLFAAPTISALLALSLPFAAHAADNEFVLTIKDHKFQPEELTVPAGQKIKLLIDNQDDSAEEFESHLLKREKVVAGKGKITLMVGPLQPGRYPFFGEYHEKTAKGVIVVQ